MRDPGDVGGAPLVGLGGRSGPSSAASRWPAIYFRALSSGGSVASSGPDVGLDQIPEALFPLLACIGRVADHRRCRAGVVIFFIGELVLSRLLYAFDLRDRPY